jgi:hypothetical protein
MFKNLLVSSNHPVPTNIEKNNLDQCLSLLPGCSTVVADPVYSTAFTVSIPTNNMNQTLLDTASSQSYEGTSPLQSSQVPFFSSTTKKQWQFSLFFA